MSGWLGDISVNAIFQVYNYKRHEFLTLHAKSIYGGRPMHIYHFSLFYFSEKYGKQNSIVCIDENSHSLPACDPAAMLRTPVMSCRPS